MHRQPPTTTPTPSARPPMHPEPPSPSEPILIETFNNNLEKAVEFYSSEVDRLYLANYLLNTQLKSSLEEKKELADTIYEMERNQRNNSQEEKKKRHRRCASDIQREFYCKAPKCGRSYGSEGSLSQHVKLKHPEMVEDVKMEEGKGEKGEESREKGEGK